MDDATRPPAQLRIAAAPFSRLDSGTAEHGEAAADAAAAERAENVCVFPAQGSYVMKRCRRERPPLFVARDPAG